MVTHAGQSPVDAGAEYCWRKFPRRSDRYAKLKRRPQVWEAGEMHDLQEFRVSSTLDNKSEERNLGSR